MIITVCWCRRKAKCAFCSEYILPGYPMLMKKIWSKGKKRVYIFYYHITCMIKESLQYLETHPYEAEIGRKKLDLTPDERRQRDLLLRRRASIRQRIRRWEESGDKRSAEKIKQLEANELAIAVEMAKVGGVPESWHIRMPSAR